LINETLIFDKDISAGQRQKEIYEKARPELVPKTMDLPHYYHPGSISEIL
jgi:hypothetical protein